MRDLYERRERIIRLLLMRGRCTMGELARELGVSERTVMRDVELLSLTRPLCVDPGRGGGVYISDYGEIGRPSLKEAEQAVLWRLLTAAEEREGLLAPGETETLREMVAYYCRPRK